MAADKTDKTTWQTYVDARTRSERIAILRQLRQQGASLPLSLTSDLLCLDLGADEKLALLETTAAADRRAFESFLLERLFDWTQDLAAPAVRLWARQTDRLLVDRMIEACRLPHLPQRVLYTLIDVAFDAGGARMVEAAASVEGLEKLSSALHGLLLHRALQWQIATPKLTVLAQGIVAELASQHVQDGKAAPAAIAYLARFDTDKLTALLDNDEASCDLSAWRDVIAAATSDGDVAAAQIAELQKLAGKVTKKEAMRFTTRWPTLWRRQALPADVVAAAFKVLPKNSSGKAWPRFAGIPVATLCDALLTLDDALIGPAIDVVRGFFPTTLPKPFADGLKARLSAAADPAALLASLPLSLRLALTGGAGDALRKSDAEGGENSRRTFFDVAYRQGKAPGGDNDYWSRLTAAWQKPSDDLLTSLAQAARPVTGVFRLCYINTLGRFKGHDQAALKLLDFVRSSDEDDLRAVIQTLAGIATPRAAQELVAAITRPNVPPVLQLEICAVLQRQNLEGLQSELRSALKDLAGRDEASEATEEVREALALLLMPGKTVVKAVANETAVKAAASDQHLDQTLTGKIPHYKELSSEVKRALRTSQFFHIHVSGESAPESIDLSPVIDMQYKALELFFRETFEEACSRVISRGVLQRRLDVIGYARPIVGAMDEFENYLASLPTIRDIPFFSKFKLRKMLRAICQFRPGKRFTLDGLKAFALFFLCFSRRECRYGLQQQFELGVTSDAELFEFCKALHVMQDFRNRAAHEGFHPDASNDIDGIWRATAEIVQTVFKLMQAVNAAPMSESEYAPKNRSNPVIVEKKVS